MPGCIILDEDIRVFDELFENRRAFRLTRVERDALLARIEVEKKAAFSGCGTSPGNGVRERASSPIRGGSILITSAPMSANILPHIGPETISAYSITRKSFSARLATFVAP